MTFGLWSSSSLLCLSPFPFPLPLPLLAGVREPVLVPWLPLTPAPLFVLPVVVVSMLEVFADGEDGEDGRSDCVPPKEAFCIVARWRSFGAGKLDFLSIASTVR